MMASRRYSTLAIYRRLLQEARGYRRHLLGIFFLNLLSTPLVLLTPLPLKMAVDNVIGSEPLSGFLARVAPSATDGNAVLVFSAGLVVAIAFLNHLQTSASSVLRTYTGERLILAFRAKLFRHAQRLSLSYHDTKGTTDSTYRIQYDAPAIEWILIDGVSPFITAGFTLCGMVFVAGRIDAELAIVALAIAPILCLISWAYRGRLRKGWNEVHALQSSALSVVQEVLAAVRVVRAFGQEEREHDRFVRYSRKSVWARMRIAFAEGSFGLLVGLTIAAGTATVLFIGTRHVQSGVLTLGGLLMVVTYIAQLYGPLQTLSSMAAHMQGSLASAERAFSLLDEVPEVAERADAVRLRRSAGAVKFRNVSFAYDSKHVALDNVSFDVPPTSRIGVTGVTGAGKSTLVSLLTRFYDPTAGQILLDGVDLRDYNLVDLRNQFAIVLQETVLFSTSIAENIAYANPAASFVDIVAAAKAANAHDFILRLPNGYDTAVGERGMRVSGGERQRIALARAFLKNAPILILDEPTSAVDVKTESVIMEAMDRLMQGRTSFIITHRQSMLKNCDVRVEIENGHLIEIVPVAVTA